MEQYIPKSALVVEIERRRSKNAKNKLNLAAAFEDNYLLSFFDTLEVKEVDLDFMLHKYWNLSSKITIDCLESVTMTKDEMINFAKHFFELGLSVSNKQIEEKEHINSPEEESNTVYKNITMINMDGNIVKSKIEQREKV